MGEEAAAAGDARRIVIHGAEDFEAMRRAGKLAAETLDFITPEVVPGVTTEALDRLCHDFIIEHGAVPAPLDYRGFPKSICTSAATASRPTGRCCATATRSTSTSP
jgi:methionyl aminopeptidase